MKTANGPVWLRWRGIARCAAVAVLLGAATTVGVCWGSAVLVHTADAPKVVCGFTRGDSVFLGEMAHRGPITTMLFSEFKAANVFPDTIEKYVTKSPAPPGWSVLNDLSEASRFYDRAQDAVQRKTIPLAYEVASGWPMPAMVARFQRVMTPTWPVASGADLQCVSGIGLPDFLVPTEFGPMDFRPRGLPLMPYWPGFLTNTLLAAVLWLAPLIGVPALRRWRRRRRGACEACGYSRRGLSAGARCPECGAGGTAEVPRDVSRSPDAASLVSAPAAEKP